jgi:hypothetical protein
MDVVDAELVDGFAPLDAEARRSGRLYRLFEATCDELFTYHPSVVHGLLQVDAYTDRMIAETGVVDEAAVRRWLDVRLDRRLTVFGREGVRVTAVLGAAALAPGIGSPAVMADQHRHLCDLSAGGSISVFVLPEGAGTTAIRHRPFTLLDFDDPRDPPVVYVETHCVADGPGAAAYRDAAASLLSQAIPVQEFLR